MSTVLDFLGFDVSQTSVVEVLGKIDPVPNGVYRAKVTSAQRRATKQCIDCWFWLLQFTILEGDHEGRSLPFRFNIVNTNQQAEEIGRGQLCHYLHCIDRLAPERESDLCGVPVWITVMSRKHSFTGRNDEVIEGVTNEIVRIEPYKDQTEPTHW